MNHEEAVQEIIDAELTPEQIEKAARAEMVAMLTMNAVLNRALHTQSALVAELQERINKMMQCVVTMDADVNDRVLDLIMDATETGTHSDRNRAGLSLIQRLIRLRNMVSFDRAKITSAAHGGSANPSEMSDIPF